MAKERVLIVDDEKNIVSSLQEILNDEGYEIVTAEDGLDALEIVQSDTGAQSFTCDRRSCRHSCDDIYDLRR